MIFLGYREVLFFTVQLIAIILTSAFAFSYVVNTEMLVLSYLIFLVWSAVLIYEKEKLTPLVFFCLLFVGYAFSGMYFSLETRVLEAKFLNFVMLPFNQNDFILALYCVLSSLVAFIIGYKLFSRIRVRPIRLDYFAFENNIRFIRFLSIALIFLSITYFLYVSILLAGGPISLLANMGVYLLLLDGSGVSTAPYLLGYSACSILFLSYLYEEKRPSFLIWVFVFLTFIMNLSTGRLSGAVFYLASYWIMYLLWFRIGVKGKQLIGIALVFFMLGGLYLFRLHSNLNYIGKELDDVSILGVLGQHFFGKTNFGDLQSIILSFVYVENKGFLFGESFGDFVRPWVTSDGVSSIGIRLRDEFFSHVSTGAPAPGIVSEMIFNFGWVGLTIGMFILGGGARLVANAIGAKRSVINLYIYTHFMLFLMLLAKVDSTHLASLIWNFGSFYFVIFVIFFIVWIFARTLIQRPNNAS